MIKKIGTILLLLIVLMVSPLQSVFGGPKEVSAMEFTINSAYTSGTVTSLSINSSGTATALCDIVGIRTVTTKVSIYAYLQQYVNGSWVSINAGYGQYPTYTGTLSFNTSVSKGYQYRVLVNYYAFSGEAYEITTDVSNVVYY